MSKYIGLQFKNEGQKTVEIDIEGTIGGSFWREDDPESKNTKEKMKAELKKLSGIKAEIIIVNINSYGGDVNHGLSIHDLLLENTAKIITKINGMTASAATVIAMAGDERKISDNSLFLAHRASSWGAGNINDIKMLADDLEKIDDRIINLYVKATGKSKEEITAIMDRNNGNGEWITPEEAKTIGFVTEIFEPRKAAAFYSNEILNAFHLPQVPENLLPKNIELENEPGWVGKIIQSVEGLSSKFKNQNIVMKEFKNLNKALNVEALESSDGKGVFLNEQQLEAIDNLLKVQDEAITAKAKEISDAQTAQTAAETNLATANAELDSIDATVKEAKTTAEKVVAIKAKMATKPGVQPEGGKGEDAKPKDEVDWDTINNLPHNREADQNL